jgi:hypothetical protein
MAEIISNSPTTAAPPSATADAAWVSIPAPLGVEEMDSLCQDLEALFRINPYLYFKTWKQIGPHTFHAEFQNQSNKQDTIVDMERVPGPDRSFTVNYKQGIKRRTVFTLEPLASPDGVACRLVIVDDYEGLPEAERAQREDEVDKSLPAWGEALRVYFKRIRRWSWLPGWRWYIRRLWVPMKPSARRIVWLLYLITIAEFGFFLLVLLIYILEQSN